MKYNIYNKSNKAILVGLHCFPIGFTYNFFKCKIGGHPFKLSLSESRYLLKHNESKNKYSISVHKNGRCKSLIHYIKHYKISTR